MTAQEKMFLTFRNGKLNFSTEMSDSFIFTGKCDAEIFKALFINTAPLSIHDINIEQWNNSSDRFGFIITGIHEKFKSAGAGDSIGKQGQTPA